MWKTIFTKCFPTKQTERKSENKIKDLIASSKSRDLKFVIIIYIYIYIYNMFTCNKLIDDLFSNFVKGKYESGLNSKIPRKLIKYIEKKLYNTKYRA